MKTMKKLVAALLAGLMVCSLVGCAGNPEGDANQTAGADEKNGLKICVVTTSGVDDGSFGETCYNGAMAYAAAHPEATVSTVKEPDMNKAVSAAADVMADYDVLVLPGFQFAPIGTATSENPNTKVILVDAEPVDAEGNKMELDNLYYMTFAEQESGFYAGIAAALQTKTGKVAVVNGIAYPSNVNYQFGFESGVNYANEKLGTSAEVVEFASYAGTDVTGANVGGNYVGSFEDEATGKVVGNALINEGVDIIFVAAGASGNGVFTAAKEANDVFVIGCDVDQFDDGVNGDKNIILTSALKVIDINVTKQLELIGEGTFKGTGELLTAAQDSTGLVITEGRHQLAAETVEKVEEAIAAVKDGSIVPASNFNGHTPEDFPGLK